MILLSHANLERIKLNKNMDINLFATVANNLLNYSDNLATDLDISRSPN